MAHKDNGRGTLVLDRRLPGVGRLKVASGTTSAQTFKRLNGMLDALVAAGRLDILRGIAARVVRPLEVWDRFRTSDLDRLPSAETIRPLWPQARPGEPDAPGAWEAWRLTIKAGKHRDAIANTAAQLRKGTAAKASVGDLPDLLRSYRKRCESAGTARAFNLARSHVQAHLRDTLGRSHHLYRQVQDIATLPVDRTPGAPFPLAELLAFLPKLASEAGDRGVLPSAPGVAAAARAMALTGMGPKEFWGKWEALDAGRLRIHGTKRKGRKRLIPLVEPIARPTVHPKTFELAVARVSGGKRSPYDFRRTFAHLMEEAGIPRARRILYMGHGGRDVTDLYEQVEVDHYLAEDREKLRAYLARVTEEQA